MKESAKKRKSMRKLKRIELVELIFSLRKDNLALEERCAALQKRLDEELALRERESSEEKQLAMLNEKIDALYRAKLSADRAEE